MPEPARAPENDAVVVYATGLLCCSVCAPATMERDAVELAVNAAHPCGIEQGWLISNDPTFKDGTPIPATCNADPARRHWLLDA